VLCCVCLKYARPRGLDDQIHPISATKIVTLATVDIREFDRERDLAAVLALVSGSRARGDAGAILHPGGLQWWLRRIGRAGFDVAVQSDGEDIVAFALRDGSDVIVQGDHMRSADRTALLAWIESRARRTNEPELFVSVAEDDGDLRRAVIERGYEPTDRNGYELVQDRVTQPAEPLLPSGFEIRSLTPELTDAYVELHRAAWSRPNAPSSYDRRQHDAVTAMPDFRHDLVPIVASAEGALAAYCISWWDAGSGAVEIEPLGTHPAFRRIGLATAIVHEVLRRSWALGARYVLVWGTSGNPEAKALYLSAGLRIRRVLRDHRLALVS
jgi:GNAT superfamily N-acetyltransferase